MFKANRLLAGASLLLIAALLMVGCGYRPLSRVYDSIAAGYAGDPIPVYMAMWDNETSESGLETTAYNTVADWLQGAEQILLKKNGGEADYLLRGTIKTIDQSSSRGTVSLTVQYSLADRASGTLTWPTTSLTFSKSYLITDDAAATQTELHKALAECIDDLGEKIYIRFLYALKDLQKSAAPAPAAQTGPPTE